MKRIATCNGGIKLNEDAVNELIDKELSDIIHETLNGVLKSYIKSMFLSRVIKRSHDKLEEFVDAATSAMAGDEWERVCEMVFNMIINANQRVAIENEAERKSNKEKTEGLNPAIFLTLNEVFDNAANPPSTRLRNALRNDNKIYVYELVNAGASNLLRIPNFGRVCFAELRDILMHYGFSIDNWYRVDPITHGQFLFVREQPKFLDYLKSIKQDKGE